MVLRNILSVPYWYLKLMFYAANSSRISEEKKRIHFVDAFNGELFSIADGEGIQLTSGDGEAQVAICRYLDENHMKIDKKVWQIQEFARRMQEIGITFAPLAD